MAVALVFVVAMFAMAKGAGGAWCVCRSDLTDPYLQKTLDYACGSGADCSPIQQSGACFNPNTVKAHCSYAANSYYQRKGQAQQACDFSGTATLTNSDPSTAGCTYPASASAAGTSATPSTTTNQGTTTSTTPGTTPVTPGSTSPGTLTPTTAGTGGVLGGLGPSGNSVTDTSNGFLSNSLQYSIFSINIISCIALLRILW